MNPQRVLVEIDQILWERGIRQCRVGGWKRAHEQDEFLRDTVHAQNIYVGTLMGFYMFKKQLEIDHLFFPRGTRQDSSTASNY